MSTDRHPLDDALAEAERLGSAYEVPVELVRVRALRLRRTRAAARAAAVVAVVGVGAVVAPLLPRASELAPADPDRAAALARCGRPFEDAAQNAELPFSMERSGPPVVIGSDRQVPIETVASWEPDDVEQVELIAHEPVLLRDGVVVAVVPVVVPEHDGEHRQEAPTSPFVWHLSAPLVSCESDGSTDAPVPPGAYEVGLTQVFRWVMTDGEAGTVRSTSRTDVTVTDEPTSTAEAPRGEPGACASDATDLYRLEDATPNPFPVTLDASVPRTVAAGARLDVVARTTNHGVTPLVGTTGHPRLVVSRDDRVVGHSAEAPPQELDASIPSRGGMTGLPVSSRLVACPGLGGPTDAPLPPGDYAVWVVVEPTYEGSAPAGADGARERVQVVLVGGPWPLTVG